MSGEGRPDLRPELDGCQNLKLAVVATKWHKKITDSLVERALAAAEDAGLEEKPTLVRVAGAIELPVMAQALARSRRGRRARRGHPRRDAAFRVRL